MLAQMKSKATRSRRLHRAIEANIAHEAGLGGTSHVTLAAQLVRSLGIRDLTPFPTRVFAHSATLWLTDGFAADFTEPEVAGWLLAAETLVPDMFAAVEPVMRRGLESGDPQVRKTTAEALGKLPALARSLAESLKELLEDSDREVREAAAGALKRVEK